MLGRRDDFPTSSLVHRNSHSGLAFAVYIVHASAGLNDIHFTYIPQLGRGERCCTVEAQTRERCWPLLPTHETCWDLHGPWRADERWMRNGDVFERRRGLRLAAGVAALGLAAVWHAMERRG